jgi:transcription elongation GreA/GreB family factor
MSVAFRRETDDEHLEPRFELPIPPGPNLVTQKGFAQIAARVTELENALATAEDDEVRKAIRRDLRYWSTRQASAQVMPPPGDDVVAFGSVVRLNHNGRERTIMLVGDDEADPAAGLLSFTAPLSRAIMGAEAGETVDFAGKPDAVTILEINPALEINPEP